MQKILIVIFFLSLVKVLPGAVNPHQKQYNLFSVSHREKKISHELESLTPPSFKEHPDYGILPYQSPCENCIELEDHRDATTRYFVEKNSGGKRFYKQQSYGAMNYRDANGWWREINYRLKKSSAEVFEANNQPFPVAINLKEKYSSLVNGDKKIMFNKNLELFHMDEKGNVKSFGTPDWSHFSAGDDGILVTDFYPGIDLQMIVLEGKLKTNFILNNRLAFHEGYIVMKQQVEFSPGIAFEVSEATKNEDDRLPGEIMIGDHQRDYFSIYPGVAYDAGLQARRIQLSNEVKSGNELLTYIPMNWLNASGTVYPVVLDPIVSTTGSLPQASIAGSQYNAVCWTGGCSYILSFLSPANCTIIGINFTFEYAASGLCTVPDGGVSFDYGACRSPAAGAYTCSTGGLGTCSFFNYSLYNDFVSCVQVPQCSAYMMDFTMHFYRCNNDLTAGCTSACIAAASALIITVTGETVQFQPGSVTSNQLICVGDSTQLYATAEYGVSPYAISWNPVGLTGDTIRVSPADTTLYHITVTDACGGSSIDSVTVFVIPNNNPGFTVTPNPTCVGQVVSISGLGTGSTANYDWLLPGSANPVVNNNQFPTTVYSLTGVDTITLNYASGFCVFPSYLAVAVNNSVSTSVSMNASPSGTICQGDSIHFSTMIVNGGITPSYQWWINGTPVTGATSDTFSTRSLLPGINIVKVEMISGLSCAVPSPATDSVTVTVTSSAIPSVNILVSPNDTVCAGSNLLFTTQQLNQGTAPSYQWQVNGGNVGVNSPSLSSSSLSSGDVVTVTMNSNAVCASPLTAVSAPVTVTIFPFVTPSISMSAIPSDTICTGATVFFQAFPLNGGISPAYQWNVNGSVSGSNSTSFSSSSSAQGDVVFIEMISSELCVTQAVATSNAIIIQTYPPLNVAVSGSTTVCPKDPVLLNAVATGGQGGPYTYFWSDGGGNGSAVTVMPATTTNYFVFASDNCNSVIATASVLVTVLNSPVATYSYSPNEPTTLHPEITFTDLSVNASQWSWDFGDGVTSTDQNPVHAFVSEGVYPVTLTVSDLSGCTDTITFNILVKEDIAVFIPNSFSPNDDGKNDTFAPVGSNLGDYEMIIFDRWGNEIFTGGPMNLWTGVNKSNKERMPAGVYPYRIDFKNATSGKKVVAGVVTLIR